MRKTSTPAVKVQRFPTVTILKVSHAPQESVQMEQGVPLDRPSSSPLPGPAYRQAQPAADRQDVTGQPALAGEAAEISRPDEAHMPVPQRSADLSSAHCHDQRQSAKQSTAPPSSACPDPRSWWLQPHRPYPRCLEFCCCSSQATFRLLRFSPGGSCTARQASYLPESSSKCCLPFQSRDPLPAALQLWMVLCSNASLIISK